MNFPDKGATAADKTVKLEGNGKAAKISVKFQVSKAVKQAGESAGTERMSATLNGRCKIYFSCGYDGVQKCSDRGNNGKLQLKMPVATQRLK